MFLVDFVLIVPQKFIFDEFIPIYFMLCSQIYKIVKKKLQNILINSNTEKHLLSSDKYSYASDIMLFCWKSTKFPHLI